MKKLVVTLALVLFAHHAEAASTIKVGVNGMVCDFCVQGLKKTFGKRDEISKIDVSMEKKSLTLGLKDGKNIDDETVTKLIVDNGLSVTGITRE